VPGVYILIVKTQNDEGELHTTGLYVGEDAQTYITAAKYAREHTIHVFEKPLQKVICVMDEKKFKSTWVANKAIYRTRKVIADGGRRTGRGMGDGRGGGMGGGRDRGGRGKWYQITPGRMGL